ncbi:MAG: FGGY-family carbohydrate kinase [Firmicutes bacterium]|nr:FGGY-family carbohydrate kinase [Bacillota bacterium]
MSERGGFLLSLTHRTTEMAVHLFDASGEEISRVSRTFERESDDQTVFHLQADEALSSAITLMESGLRRAGILSYDVSGIGLCVSCHALIVWNGVSGTPLLTTDFPMDWIHFGAQQAATFLADVVDSAMREPEAPSDARDLRLGGMDGWLLFSLTQGACCWISQGHDLTLYAYGEGKEVDAAFAQRCGVVSSCFPTLMQPGQAARISPIYLDASRPAICALTYIETAALVGARFAANSSAFVTYDAEGSVSLRMPYLRSTQQTSGELGVRPLVTLARDVPASALMGRYVAPQLVAGWLQAHVHEDALLAQVATALTGGKVPLVLPADRWLPGQATVVGLDPSVTTAQLYAGALCSMAFMVADIVEKAETLIAARIEVLYADELGYGIPSLFSLQAGLCKRPLYVRAGDSSALGAAVLAGIAAGLWSHERAATILEQRYTTMRYDVPELSDALWDLYSLYKRISAHMAS